MQQALTAPMFRSVVLGGLVLALGAVYAGSASSDVKHRLRLHAVEQPNFIYMTAWRDGDIEVAFEGGDLAPITFHTRAMVSDGCKWLGIEQLTPIDNHSFFYTYSEKILSCRHGATPYIKTPRTGIVTIVD